MAENRALHTLQTPCKLNCRIEVSPHTLPILRHRSRIGAVSFSPARRRIGSPIYLGSPSRLESTLKSYTWRDVKGHLGTLLGRGGFGSVYKANIQGFTLAIKKLCLSSVSKAAVLRSLQSENLACGLRHQNIVGVYHVNDKSDPAFVVMEFIGKRNLQHVIDSQTLSSALVRLFSRDIASALHYLHSLNLVHLDLKPSNVLITPYQIAKLGDFGCLERLNWDETRNSVSPTNRLDVTGTVAYRAPELLKGCPPSLQADIYAYGILVWQMLSQKNPYCGKNIHVIIFAVVAQGLRPSLSGLDCEEEMITLCQRCWSALVEDRPSADQIISILNDIERSHTPAKRCDVFVFSPKS